MALGVGVGLNRNHLQFLREIFAQEDRLYRSRIALSHLFSVGIRTTRPSCAIASPGGQRVKPHGPR